MKQKIREHIWSVYMNTLQKEKETTIIGSYGDKLLILSISRTYFCFLLSVYVLAMFDSLDKQLARKMN